MLNTEYLAWKKAGGTKLPAHATPWQDPIDKMVVNIQVLKAKNLVAKDRNIFGKRTTSDPYVLVSLSCTPAETVSNQKRVQKIELGRTQTISKHLSPTWNYTLPSDIPFSRYNETLQLVFEIFDQDKLSSDDSLGVVKLEALQWKDSSGASVWHEIPKDSAKNVSGMIKINISTSLHRVQGLNPYC